MGRFVKSMEEIAYRPWKRFRSWEDGPITVVCSENCTTATTASGLVVSVAAETRYDRRLDLDQLRAGVELRRDGVLIGHLRQTERNEWRRSKRVLHVIGVEPGRVPPGAHVRLRGVGTASLEDDDGRLVGYLSIPPFLRLPRIRAGTAPELVALFIAVDHGYREPLRGSAVRGRPT